jgi:hypothetical protein
LINEIQRNVVSTSSILDTGDGLHEFVGWADAWIGDVFVLEMNCVGEAFLFGLLDVAIVYSIMFR